MAWYYRLSIYRGMILHDIVSSTTPLKVKLRSDFELTKNGHISLLRANYELFGEKWPLDIGSVLYH